MRSRENYFIERPKNDQGILLSCLYGLLAVFGFCPRGLYACSCHWNIIALFPTAAGEQSVRFPAGRYRIIMTVISRSESSRLAGTRFLSHIHCRRRCRRRSRESLAASDIRARPFASDPGTSTLSVEELSRLSGSRILTRTQE